MSVINPGSTLGFKSTDSLFARVRKRLRSFDAAGIIDEGDWYFYIKETVDKLGVSVYEEKEAAIIVKNYKAPRPEDFSYLYAAYSCTSSYDDGSYQTVFPQTGFVFYLEESCQAYRECKTGCRAGREVYGNKVTVRTVIEGKPTSMSFSHPSLLSLAGTTKEICNKNCANLSTRGGHQISIDSNWIHTNFSEGSIYMKYYGLALDTESGLPLIPDNTYIEKAIEDYIVYRVFEDFWLNGDVPDIERRYRDTKFLYEDSLKAALYWAKTPTFQNAINKIRADRGNLGIYQM